MKIPFDKPDPESRHDSADAMERMLRKLAPRSPHSRVGLHVERTVLARVASGNDTQAGDFGRRSGFWRIRTRAALTLAAVWSCGVAVGALAVFCWWVRSSPPAPAGQLADRPAATELDSSELARDRDESSRATGTDFPYTAATRFRGGRIGRLWNDSQHRLPASPDRSRLAVSGYLPRDAEWPSMWPLVAVADSASQNSAPVISSVEPASDFSASKVTRDQLVRELLQSDPGSL